MLLFRCRTDVFHHEISMAFFLHTLSFLLSAFKYFYGLKRLVFHFGKTEVNTMEKHLPILAAACCTKVHVDSKRANRYSVA